MIIDQINSERNYGSKCAEFENKITRVLRAYLKLKWDICLPSIIIIGFTKVLVLVTWAKYILNAELQEQYFQYLSS